jgi:3-hydroxybutyrate dehydrogenase
MYTPRKQKSKELAVVVTGCDSGFGREIAIWAAEVGFIVFAGCLKKESLQQFVDHKRIHPIVMDVTSDKDVQSTVDQVRTWLTESVVPEQKNRVLHGLVCNAGILLGGELDLTELLTYQKVMDVNFFGMVRCCKAFLPIFQGQSMDYKHTGSRIINLVSVAGLCPMEAGSAYASSKHAAIGFTDSLRAELRPFRIQVSTVNPAFHNTPILDHAMELGPELLKSLPLETREKYGEEYFEQKLKATKELIEKSSWKMDVVVEYIVHSLEVARTPAEAQIGLDARFSFMPILMLPKWLSAAILRKLLFSLPKPAAMKLNK